MCEIRRRENRCTGGNDVPQDRKCKTRIPESLYRNCSWMYLLQSPVEATIALDKPYVVVGDSKSDAETTPKLLGDHLVP